MENNKKGTGEDIDNIFNLIIKNEKAECPVCHSVLKHFANKERSKIYCIYCEKCHFNVKFDCA